MDSRLDADLFDIIKNEKEFQVFYGAEPYLTTQKKPIIHISDSFLKAIIADYQLKSNAGASGFSYFNVLNYKTDILDGHTDPFSADFESWISDDPFIQLKNSESYAAPILSPDDPLFSFCFNTISELIGKVNIHISGMMGQVMIDENEINPIQEVVRSEYESLDNWKKAVIHALYEAHQAGIVMLLGLVNGTINPSEYAKGLVSLRKSAPDEFGKITQEAAEAISFLSYLSESQNNINKFQTLVNEGEGDFIEFKSTLRWDIRAGKTNPAIERASLKTIAAFLNSRGGALLIGVRDDGSVEGIETDKFPNDDRFLLHLWTLIRTCLGRDVSPFIRTVLEKHDEKTVCIVNCQPASRPVFLRQPGFDEELYIRLGPSSNAMIISEAITYIRDRFPES